MGITVYSFLWVKQDVDHQPQEKAIYIGQAPATETLNP